MTTHRSFCRICVSVCGLQIDLADDGTATVRGDPDHPISRGYTCPKGRALVELHRSPRRLDGPLVRDRAGALVPATWDDALGSLGDALRAVADQHGREAIGFFKGGGIYFDAAGAWAAARLQRALGTTHVYSNMSIDSAGKFRVAELMAGTYSLTPQIDPGARLVLLLGTNPVVSHGQLPVFENPVERLRSLRRSARVWVVDPRTTESARLAHRHLPIRPGADQALLAHLVRAVLEHADRPALAERLRNVDVLAEAVAPYTLERTVADTGLDAAAVDELRRAVLDAGRLAVLSGTGITMSPGANTTEWLVLALLLVTDSLDRPGGMWCNPGYLARLDQREVLPAAPPRAEGAPTRPDIARLMGEWPASLIPAEIEAGNLRALVVLAGNLVTCLPETPRVLAALARLDVLAVVEVNHTDTTALATHVLPTHGQLERPDVALLTDLYHPVVSAQYTDAVLPRRSGARSAWWVFERLGRALGVNVLPDGLDAATATDHDVLRRVAGAAAFDALRSAPDPWLVAPTPAHGWVEERLPAGRWDVAPAPLVDQLAAATAATCVPGAGAPDDGELVLIPRRRPRRMNGQPLVDSGVADVLVHPADAERLGIRSGDTVEVTSQFGSLRVTANVTDAIRPGAVSVAHGNPEANVNCLLGADDLDPLTGMPRMSGTPVRLHVVGAGTTV